jgi:hypothetical protein
MAEDGEELLQPGGLFRGEGKEGRERGMQATCSWLRRAVGAREGVGRVGFVRVGFQRRRGRRLGAKLTGGAGVSGGRGAAGGGVLGWFAGLLPWAGPSCCVSFFVLFCFSFSFSVLVLFENANLFEIRKFKICRLLNKYKQCVLKHSNPKW